LDEDNAEPSTAISSRFRLRQVGIWSGPAVQLGHAQIALRERGLPSPRLGEA
jgi:hypothetical protein